tara:strand:+ start:2872 stop:3231 length:360 start_codon:yes stop_codon:yes gene_type:complete
MENKILNKIGSVRLKNNTNTLNILRLSFKFYPDEARTIMYDVNKWDRKIAELLDEMTKFVKRRDYELILDDLEKLRGENNGNWMKLYELAQKGSSEEYEKLLKKENEYGKQITKLEKNL